MWRAFLLAATLVAMVCPACGATLRITRGGAYGGGTYEQITIETSEPVVIETLLDGELVRRREGRLDSAGFGVAALAAETATGPGFKLLRVTSPSFGVLEAGLRTDGTFDDGPQRWVPGPAPVQIPSTRRLVLRLAT